MKSLLASVALVAFLAMAPVHAAGGEIAIVGETFEINEAKLPEVSFPRVKREIFKPRADGKRDELQHLLYLAESPNTQRKRARGYRNLAEILLQVGRGSEAMRAYEAAALQGDGPSATIIMRAHAEGRYKPVWFAELLTMVYAPRAKADGTSGPMLMAKLISSGRIEGFGSSTEWLQIAASRGSAQATFALAEAAERRGKIATAAKLYASVDKVSKLERALRQARVNFLGEDQKANPEIALAWLDYAAGIDAAAAGEQAAKLYRKDAGSEAARTRLLEVATAGGVNPPSKGSGSGSGSFTRLREAKTDAERTAILAEIKTAADAGNATAALAFAQDRLSAADPATEDEAYRYLEQALAAGLEPAVTDIRRRLVTLPKDSPRTAELLAAMTKAADAGVASAMWSLADLYAWGGPVPADQTRSLAYMQSAADAGHVDAQLRLGLHFAQRTDDPDQAERARHYLEAAAKQGSASAQAYLAGMKPAV